MTSLDLIIRGKSKLNRGTVAVVGLPWEGGSSHLSGAAQAPERIRRLLLSTAGNLTAESSTDLSSTELFRIFGDLELDDASPELPEVTTCSHAFLELEALPLFLGGDHSITNATVAAFETKYSNLTLVQFDAHPDLYDDFEGDRYSHACPMARILERGQLSRLIQIGIRAGTSDQLEQARRYDVVQIPATTDAVVDWSALRVDGPLYVSFDLDVLDPAFAPGVSHPEHGGISSRQAISMIQNLPATIVGADIVELNPARDVNNLTAGVAAKLLKELASKMLEGRGT